MSKKINGFVSTIMFKSLVIYFVIRLDFFLLIMEWPTFTFLNYSLNTVIYKDIFLTEIQSDQLSCLSCYFLQRFLSYFFLWLKPWNKRVFTNLSRNSSILSSNITFNFSFRHKLLVPWNFLISTWIVLCS